MEEEEEEEREALLRIIKKAQSTIKTNRVFLLRCLFSSMWKFSPFLCGFRNAAAAAAGWWASRAREVTNTQLEWSFGKARFYSLDSGSVGGLLALAKPLFCGFVRSSAKLCVLRIFFLRLISIKYLDTLANTLN